MKKQKIKSREYKIMLLPGRFTGNEVELINKAGAFWQDFSERIMPVSMRSEGSFHRIKNRTIQFYDTQALLLRKSHFVCRARKELSTGDREVTLKFRHPDRYIAQDRDLSATKKKAGKQKFEEDIKPPYVKLYSHSTKQQIKSNVNLHTLGDISRLYPHFKEQVKPFNKQERVILVGNFTAREKLITGAEFLIRNHPKRYAECALILWYNNEVREEGPLLAEFSFKYEDGKENYTRKMTLRAYEIFLRLQNNLADWISPQSVTKTSYLYNLAPVKV